MRKPSGQSLVVVGGLALASCALALAVIYSGDQQSGPAVLSGANTGLASGPTGGVTPIEGWFPITGKAGACSEKIGIDLIAGYAATLTVNGVPIPPEAMNTFDRPDVNDPSVTVLSSDGSLDRYTWGPEGDCPNGEILRTGRNLVVACVYQTGDNPLNCLNYQYAFEVL